MTSECVVCVYSLPVLWLLRVLGAPGVQGLLLVLGNQELHRHRGDPGTHTHTHTGELDVQADAILHSLLKMIESRVKKTAVICVDIVLSASVIPTNMLSCHSLQFLSRTRSDF